MDRKLEVQFDDSCKLTKGQVVITLPYNTYRSIQAEMLDSDVRNIWDSGNQGPLKVGYVEISDILEKCDILTGIPPHEAIVSALAAFGYVARHNKETHLFHIYNRRPIPPEEVEGMIEEVYSRLFVAGE